MTRMNRRDFLRPKRLAATAGLALRPLDSGGDPEPRSGVGDVSLLRAARRAMATTFEVVLPFAIRGGVEAADGALDVIEQVESQLTVYRDDSEASRINRLALSEAVAIGPELCELLAAAARLTEETGGAFDVTAGPLIKAWGFFRRCQRVPPADELAAALSCVGMSNVELDTETGAVRFRKPGVQINLGSIGKGYALDRAALFLRRAGVTSALLHGGHSSVVALGAPPGDPRGWAVAVRHPWDFERRLAVLRLRNCALATSAATFQNVEYAGRKLGHILDPRTGWPAEGSASVTVVAPTGAKADALATAFFINGAGWGREYCASRFDVGALFLEEGKDEPVAFGLEAQASGGCRP
jgi:thiamine biosynthesis lipoprotein